MLVLSVQSVNSASNGARSSLPRHQQPTAGYRPPHVAGSFAEDAIVAEFARACESVDLDGWRPS